MPSAAQIEAALLALLAGREKTACPSEVARSLGGNWRALMPRVREAAARLAGRVEVLQRGEPVDPLQARGPIRMRLARSARTDSPGPEVARKPTGEGYRVGRGEEGVFQFEPYKSELLPLWRFRTPELAAKSAKVLYARFVDYGRAGDAVGMDLARKYLQMGWTRSRRYTNHAGGRKYGPDGSELPRGEDPVKAECAAIFLRYLTRARKNRTYRRLLKTLEPAAGAPRRR